MRPAHYWFGIGLLIVAGFLLARADWTEKSSGTMGETDNGTSMTLSLTSTVFEHNGKIPPKYTCDGNRTLNPPLAFGSVPEGTRSLALIMDDPDVPKAVRPEGIFDHWALFNIPPRAAGIPEGGSAGTPGVNGAGNNAYTGPCPPPQYEPSEHRYVFVLYALDTELPLKAGTSKRDILNAMQGHILGKAELIGLYKRI